MPSTRFDLIVRGGAVVTAAGIGLADIGVAGGRIVALEPELAGAAAAEIDAAGLHVLPGVVDAHMHINEPGRTEWEGWVTGTAALAAGGGTLCIDMPLNAHPPTLDAPSFDAKLAATAGSVTDFAFWGGLTPGNLDRLDELAARGVVGFKAFMSRSGTDDFPHIDDGSLLFGMQAAARLGLPVAVHAENDAITSFLAARAVAEGRLSVRDYLASRPAIAETEAISRAILLAEEARCALHVVHVSTGRGVALVAAGRARGVDVTCETCPHYLVFAEEDVEALGVVAKCAPPIRDAAERAALWAALADGSIQTVASDHSPAPMTMKAGADFFQIWGGISGCQSTLPALLNDGHHRRGLPLPRIAAVLADAPARRFRLVGKGRIAVGCDADLALVALRAEFTLAAADLLYRHAHSPYVGRTFMGRVARTIRRGETIALDGRIVASTNGAFVHPETATAV